MANIRKSLMVEIRLTKAQRERCEMILKRCTDIWNHYIYHANICIESGERILNARFFDRDWYPTHIVNTDPTIKSELPSKARRDAMNICWRWIKTRLFKVGRTHIPYRTSMVDSFFLIKNGIRLLPGNRMWVPILHEIKLKEKGYITSEILEWITSARIVYKPNVNRWFIMVIIYAPAERLRREFVQYMHDGVGIDLGTHTLLYIYGGDIEWPRGNWNPCLDTKCECITKRIFELNSIITHKVRWNKIRLGYDPDNHTHRISNEDFNKIYNSNRIKKLRKRVAKMYERLHNHRRDAIKKICSYIVRNRPQFVCVESLDITEMRRKGKMNARLRRAISSCNFWYIRDFLHQKCDEYQIPFIEADIMYPSSRICSCCGHTYHGKFTHADIMSRVYTCQHCGYQIDRDKNAAINLYRYGQLRCQPGALIADDKNVLHDIFLGHEGNDAHLYGA